ncbi:MAG TPA: sulfotransferase [Rhizomicrobium sp.]|nr:sulfotransferase [Rhizomicrobium sp.]
MGDALHAQRRYGEAFGAYQACNAELQRIHTRRFLRSGIETVPQYLVRLIDYFSLQQSHRWSAAVPSSAPHADDPARHIFIVGFPRSGTTLLENVLGCLPNTVTTDERDGLADGVREFMAAQAGLDRLAAAQGSILARYRRAYWKRLHERGLDHKNRIFIDKQPYNTVKLPLIAKLFPQAKIVFVVRDPRDVVLSCFRQRFKMNPSNFELLTLDGAARLYDLTMRLAEIYRSILSLDIQYVRHEDLLANFEKVIHSLCTHLNVAWDQNVFSFADRARNRAIATASANQVMKGLMQTPPEQWRHYHSELAPILPVLEPWVRRFGYSAS